MVAWRRTLLAAAAFAAALPAARAGADARQATAVGVSAREFRLAVYRDSAPRGVLRFNLANYGEDAHNLVVRDRDGRELARSQEARAGQRTTLRVRLAAGRYRLVCDLADHERRGMRTSIVVTRPRPARR
jgi:plastocyanin